MVAPIDKRQRLMQRHKALLSERSSWDSQYRDIARFLLPRNSRFFRSDRNRGDRRHEDIYDGTGFLAMETAVAGLCAVAIPSTEPWFEARSSRADLNQVRDNQVWFDEATKIGHEILRASNFYAVAPRVLEEDLGFGTGCAFVEDDFDDVIRLHHVTCGEYVIAQDWKQKVCAFFREFDISAEALVREFGPERCSLHARRLAEERPDAWVSVLHAIQRRDTYGGRQDNAGKPWESCYVEIAGDSDQVLRESGFDEFRVLAPRWKRVGGDVYGGSPGMAALPFVMGSQLMHMAASTIVDKLQDPPLRKPATMKNREVEQQAGGETPDDGESGSLEPIYVPHPQALNALRESQFDYRDQIRAALHADKFLMLQLSADKRKTAAEVHELQNEKYTVLGPFAENLHNEFLGPMVEILLRRAMRVGALPPPPPTLSGHYTIKFVSRLAQVARAQSFAPSARFVAELGAVANIKREVLDRLDADAWVDEARETLGAPSKLVLPVEQVRPLRERRAQAEGAVAQAKAVSLQAKTARDLAAAPTGDEQNALTDLARGGVR